MLLSKPFLISLWYLNTTDRIFSTFYRCLQFSFNVWSPGKALWKTHSRRIKYGGVWGKSHFSCMPSLKATEWGSADTQIWSLGWSWHYKPKLCQATFYNHSAFFPLWISRFFQMFSTGSTDLSSTRLGSFKWKECPGSAAAWAAILVHILFFETLSMNQSHKVTDRRILL